MNYLVTMVTTTWSSCIGHIIMSTLLCHVYKGHADQNALLLGKYRVYYLHISPNCYYILKYLQIPWQSQNQFYCTQREGPKEHLVKIALNKISVFERENVTVH